MSAIKLTAASLALLALTATADAGNHCRVKVNPQPTYQNQWYFGMSVQLNYSQYGQGLEVYSVRRFGPAARAGLEPGDVILSANSWKFFNAYNNRQAVQILQNSVQQLGGPVPTGPVSGGPIQTFTQNVSARVAPAIAPNQGMVQLEVLDSRTGRVVYLTLYPEHNGFGNGGGGPVPTATFSN